MSETSPFGSGGPSSPSYHNSTVWLVACFLGVALVAVFAEKELPSFLMSVRVVGSLVGEVMAIACVLLATIRALEGSPRSLASLPSLGVVLVGSIALATEATFTVVTFGALVATMLIVRRLRPVPNEAAKSNAPSDPTN